MAKAPEHIEKYKKLRKHADQIADTTARHHRQAYDSAVEDLLIPEGKKDADYDKLKKTKMQVKFANKMADFYIKKAREYFGAHGDLDELEKELLMKAYSGTTKATLRDIVSDHKHKFSFDKFKEHYDGLVAEIRGTLSHSASSHFTKDNLDDILKYALQPEVIKKLKPYMSLEKAKMLLGHFLEEEEAVKYEVDKYDIPRVLDLNEKIKQATKGRMEILPKAVTGKIEKELEKESGEPEEELDKAA